MTRQVSKSAGESFPATAASIPSANTVVISSVRNMGIKFSTAPKSENLSKRSGESFLT
jgi:hypothetical protein